MFRYSQHALIKLLYHDETGHLHLQPAEARL